MTWLLVAAAVVAVLWAAHRLASWAESRGWIYYRTKRMPPGSGGMAMMEVGRILEPELEHVIEEIHTERPVSEDGLDDDDPGGG